MNRKTVHKDTDELSEQEIREIREENQEREQIERANFRDRIVKEGSIGTMM